MIDEPDDQTMYFKIKSSLIDENTIKDVYGSEFYESHQIEIPIKFWKCTWGEWISEQSCEVCKYGTYSFEQESKECKECMWYVECQGGHIISLEQGYWRSGLYSENIYECLKKTACLGGYQNDTVYPVSCA